MHTSWPLLHQRTRIVHALMVGPSFAFVHFVSISPKRRRSRVRRRSTEGFRGDRYASGGDFRAIGLQLAYLYKDCRISNVTEM